MQFRMYTIKNINLNRIPGTWYVPTAVACQVRDIILILQGTRVNRTYGVHKNLYI